MRISSLLKAWNEFFFKPISPISIALFRIFYGMIVVHFCITLFPNASDFFGTHSIVSLETARGWYGPHRMTVFAWLPQTDMTALIVLAALFCAAFLLTVGCYTRRSAAAVFILLVSLLHRNPAVFNGAEAVMRLMAFHLAFSHAGAALSVDRWLRVKRGVEGPELPLCAPWAQRMIQIQYAIVYLVTVAWKLRGSHWVDGTALFYTSRLAEYWRYHVPYVFEHLWTIRLATWGTLLLEASLGALLWIKELRYPLLIGGLLLHLGIEYTMVVPFFSWLMMAGYVTYVDPKDLIRVMNILPQSLRRDRIAVELQK